MFVMVITTCLVTLVMLLVWDVRLALAAVFFGFFFIFEMVFLSANVYKVSVSVSLRPVIYIPEMLFSGEPYGFQFPVDKDTCSDRMRRRADPQVEPMDCKVTPVSTF